MVLSNRENPSSKALYPAHLLQGHPSASAALFSDVTCGTLQAASAAAEPASLLAGLIWT